MEICDGVDYGQISLEFCRNLGVSSEFKCRNLSHFHLELSCNTITGRFNVIDEFSLPQLSTTDEEEPEISSFICLQYSDQKLEEKIIKTLSDWNINSFHHYLISTGILNKLREIDMSLNPKRKIRKGSLSVNVISSKYQVSNVWLFNQWRERFRRQQEAESEGAMLPTKESSIKSLKRKRIESENDGDNDEMGCAVCLEEFVVESEVSCMPCSHLFHENCITDWLRRSHYCPLCRFKMPTIG